MTYRVRYTREARDDLKRLYAHLLASDLVAARRALDAITKATELLRDFPFSCRKAEPDDPFLRELLIPFGGSGYVALYRIEEARTVTLIAIRHQREADYH